MRGKPLFKGSLLLAAFALMLTACGDDLGDIDTIKLAVNPWDGSAVNVAVAAAVLAWADVHVLWQWLVFFGATVVSFVYLRRFVGRQNDVEQPRVGANRLIDARGQVIERVDEDAQTGMVRIGGEQWRAIAAEPIEVDTRVMVTEIDGTRLVVVPTPRQQAAESTES